MCQAYESEREAVVASELRVIREKWAAYRRGEILVVMKMLLEER